MSLGHGASVVRNGLVLHLDAANAKSYPGSGTVWKDVSKERHTATLVNGISHDGTNFTFDGISDYVDVGNDPSYNATGSITIELVFNRTSVGSGFYQVVASNTRDCCGVYDGFQIQISNSTVNPAPIVCNLWNSNNYNGVNWDSSFTQLSISNSVGVNVWYHFCFTYDLFSSSFKLYKNGILANSSTKANALSTNQASYNLMVGKSPSHNANFTGYIPETRIYNRALSADEIKQNFNALRGRYGI